MSMASGSNMKVLAKETAIYGLSSIIGKFLNWLLVPLYTFVLEQQADYGIVTNLYAWIALLLVVLTYGMETGFFRFANKEGEDPATVYTTAMSSLLVTSLLFVVTIVLFSTPITSVLGYSGHEEFITLMGIVVALDAFCSIPFAYLRFRKQAIRFAALKLLFVALNIFFNIFFLVICPKLADCPLVQPWYDPDYGVGYVFVANILSTGIQTLCLLPTILAERYHFSWSVLRQMLRYSLPLLVLGVCGIMNQTLDRILFRYLHPAILSADSSLPMAQQIDTDLGIYGACFKVAMVMMMFTQAFRYAYEPFVFAKHKDKQSVEAYADAMKYYIFFSLLIVLGMTFYLDILRCIISPAYWDGLRIVPIVLWTYVFQGVYFNLSFWYKLTDKTRFGAYFSLLGVVITFVLQVCLVPRFGYVASAGSSTICFFVLMLISYLVGLRYLDIPYDMKRIGLFTLLTVLLLVVFQFMPSGCGSILRMGIGTVLLGIYCVALFIQLKKDQIIRKKSIV